MPTLARLTDTVRICMYAGDHNPPHFHVLTGNGRAFMVRLDDLQILAGQANAKAFALAVAWAADNRDMLAARWADLND